jgi:hypothetical protein
MAAQHRRPGLNVARKRLASGEVREYFYDRESGAFLGHDRAKAQAALDASRHDSHPAPGTVSALIADYLASTRFKSRADLTQRDYRHWLGVIRDEYGDLPVRGMRPGHIERIKARYEATPRKVRNTTARDGLDCGRRSRVHGHGAPFPTSGVRSTGLHSPAPE